MIDIAVAAAMVLGLVAVALLDAGVALSQTAPAPVRDELFWCQQQRDFNANNAMSASAIASKLSDENAKLKAEIEELKKKLPADK